MVCCNWFHLTVLSSRRQFLQILAAAAASSAVSTAQSPTLARFPYLQDIRRQRATIRWTVRAPGVGVVEYWDEAGERYQVTGEVQAYMPAETGMAFPYYRHEAVLSKLTPGSEYRYRALVNGQPVTSQILRFRTPGIQPFRFLAFGDSGTGSKEQQLLSQMMMGEPAKLVIHTGDLVYPTGTYERYESLYFELYKDIMKDVPFFPCPGNHDYYELKCIPYLAMHSVPQESVAKEEAGRYYSFDWGNVHFVSLDSNDALEAAAAGSGKMLEWLDKDLSQTDKFWRIVFVHHAAYSAGKHADGYEAAQVRKWIVPILEKHRVPLVLNGHEHSYQRSYPIRGGKVVEDGPSTTYITTGGGGADLHPIYSSDFVKLAVAEHHYLACDVTGAKLQLRATSINGSELDSTTIAPQPVLRTRAVVNGADYSAKLASGGLISIFGLQFAPEDMTANRFPLPKSGGGASVLLNGESLPLLMTSASQINAQLPFQVSGEAELTVRNPNGSATVKIQIDPVAPAIFDGAIFHANGLQVTEETPASAGSLVSVYLTGLGVASGTIEPGEASPALPVKAPVLARLGNQTVSPQFAGLAEGAAGVNLVRFNVPGGIQRSVPVSILAGGVESNPITLYVR